MLVAQRAVPFWCFFLLKSSRFLLLASCWCVRFRARLTKFNVLIEIAFELPALLDEGYVSLVDLPFVTAVLSKVGRHVSQSEIESRQPATEFLGVG